MTAVLSDLGVGPGVVGNLESWEDNLALASWGVIEDGPVHAESLMQGIGERTPSLGCS